MLDVDSIQHFNVKIFASQAAIDLGDAIPVFHRWIQQSKRAELLLDVADYRHVPAGPGVILVAHEAIYGLDQRHHRLGLLYNRKAALPGSAADRLEQAWRAALDACRDLEQEPEFAGKLRFDAGDVEVTVNDRLLAPNTEETWQALRPVLEPFFAQVYGTGGFALERAGDPRETFRVTVKAGKPLPVADLLAAASRA